VPEPAAPSDATCLIDPPVFLARIEAAARAQGFRPEHFGEIAKAPLLALTKRTPGPRPRIYLSAGIHGDEPAPPLALLDLIERGVLDARAVWFVCPLLNPAGFNCRRRENAEGLDLNRDYKALRSLEIQAHARWLQRQPNFTATFHVHEDWEAAGFYLYELCSDAPRSVARVMLTAASAHLPIEPATVIDGRAIAEPGIIRPINDPSLRDSWPESIYLRAHHTQLGYTIETPSSAPLERRVAALSAAISAALNELCPRVGEARSRTRESFVLRGLGESLTASATARRGANFRSNNPNFPDASVS
jgi:protein MpaA